MSGQDDEYWDDVAARTKARFSELLHEQTEHPGGITDPKPDIESHGHWHVKHPLTSWERLWHLNHFGDRPGHSHEAHGLGPRC